MESSVREELRQSRLKLKWEMQRALSCMSASSKRRLAEQWREKYSDIFYKELLNCARNRKVAAEIADWDVEKLK